MNIYNGRQEPYGLERIEFLKGASSVLYGAMPPGGVINTVSKRPTVEPLRELNVEAGSFRRRQVSADFGGALDQDGTWSYRLTALRRDSDTFVDHVPDDRTYVAPAIKWQPNEATSLTLLAEYQQDRTVYVYGLPAQGTVLPNPNGRIPRNRFTGEPGLDEFKMKRYSVGYLFEHAFTSQLKLRHNLRYINAKSDYGSTDLWQLMPDGRRTADRGFSPRVDRSSAVSTDTSLQYQTRTGIVEHTLLAGLDYSTPKHETRRYFQTLDNLDLYDPVYGSPLGPVTPNLNSSTKSDTKRLGIYLQDQMKIADKWVVLLGGRQDWVRANEHNLFTGEQYAQDEKTKAFTGRAGFGLPGRQRPGAVPQLQPVLRADHRPGPPGQPLQAHRRRAIRSRPALPAGGLRHHAVGRRVPADAQEPHRAGPHGHVVPDPGRQGPFTRVGAGSAHPHRPQRQPDRRLRLHRRAHAQGQPLAARRRRPAPGFGAFQSVLDLGDYGFGDFGLPGLRVGAGLRYVGSTRGMAHGTAVEVPSFTLLDAMVSYTTGPWRFALNATNLADKTYIGSCTYGCFYGEPRRIIGTATYRW